MGMTNGTRPTRTSIRIDDLLDPVRTPLQQQIFEQAEAATVVLDPEAILAAARAQSGLDDFGADDFRERLAVWCRAIDEDANASGVTRANLFQMMIRYAATRLRVEDIVARHPEILDIAIDRPIIVAGLPRSGTTHLLGLLSADARLRSLPWWEAIAPVPAHGDGTDPRWADAEVGWRAMEAILPHMTIMHEFSPDHISEDIELQAIDFSSYLLEWLAYVPRWRDYYLAHDQAGTYAYLKKGLQVLSFLRGPSHWVIKCPQHMEQLSTLRRTFPDATFVVTHRDPVASIRSQLTMATYAARMLRRTVDREEAKAYWIDRYERMLRACVRDRDVLPPEQTIDVYFHEWTRDPDPILHAIYAKAGMTLTPATLAALHAYSDAHGEDGKPRIAYDLEGDFGITADAVRGRFGFYFDRFPVAREVR